MMMSAAKSDEKILIAVIDDDVSFRMALGESLKTLGYDSREFGSAEEFVASEEKRPCDCVITDIHMPGMNGFELSRLLTSREFPVPVIAITAVAEPGLDRKAAANGSFCLLKKPFGLAALVDCLQRALNG